MIDWDRYPNFSFEEMLCHCGCGRADMHEDFMERLQAIRTAYGQPMRVASGYRCPDYNRAVGGGPEHPMGKAADIGIVGREARALLTVAVSHFPRLGVWQAGPVRKRFIHLGTATNNDIPGLSPWLWSY